MDTKPLNITPRVKKALATADKIARANGDNYVGSQHVFLALLDNDQPHVRFFFMTAGLSMEDFRHSAEKSLPVLSANGPWLEPDKSGIAAILRELADRLE